jgi:valyl-tRNA synthetase
VENLKVMIPVPQELLTQEKNRLNKEKERLASSLEKISSQLANPDFVTNAPPQLIEKQQGLLTQTKREFEEVTNKLNALQ